MHFHPPPLPLLGGPPRLGANQRADIASPLASLRALK